MKKALVFILPIFILGCTKFTKETLPPLRENVYSNPAFLGLPRADQNLELSKAKGNCNVEAYKLQIPSPSCSTMPAPNCAGLTGFAQGFCRGQQPYQKCDYSSVNAAKAAQVEIFNNCMIASGWLLSWENGKGFDVSGGVFEKIARNDEIGADFYLKTDSIINEGNEIKAIVRTSYKADPKKSYQGYWTFYINENKFRVDNDEKRIISPTSGARLVLNRIEELKN